MGMSAGSSSGRNGGGRAANRMVLSEINVTPLVDVMLVLLIIFMVTTPLIKEGVEIDVPDVTAAAIEQSEEQLTLAIKKNRAIYIGNTEVALDELEDKLKHNALIQAKGAMYLEADQGLPYGFVVEVMTIARRAGVRDLGLVTEPPRALD